MYQLLRCIKHIFPLFIALFMISCNNNKEDEKRLKELRLCFENSNQTIDRMSKDYLYKLSDDLVKPVTKERAIIWHTLAKFIERESNEMLNYLGTIEQNVLKKKASEKLSDTEIKNLYKKLILYKQRILLINSQINAAFKDVIKITTDEKDKAELDESLFYNSFKSNYSLLNVAIDLFDNSFYC